MALLVVLGCILAVFGITDHCNRAKCSCYTVISGDYPYKIATKLGTTYEELQAVNPDMSPSALGIGDILSVPSATCVPPPPPPPVPPTPPQPGPCTSVDWSNANKFKGDKPLTGYVGGNRIPGWEWTSSKWEVYDLLVIGFVQQWSKKSSTDTCGPAHLWTGLPGYPTFKSGACGDWGNKLTNNGVTCSQVQNCRDFSGSSVNQGAQGLKKWQNAGQRRALISVGGAIASATFSKEEEGATLARVLWEMYLGGSDSRYDDYRPFGRDVILDGVDLDLENAVSASSPTATGWGTFVTTMRALMDADNRKEYLIAAAPINPTYAGSYGQEQYGSFNFARCSGANSNAAVSTAALNAVSPANSVYGHLDALDYIFPQFYNTPDQNICSGQSASNCVVPAARCFKYCMRHWAAIVEKYGKGKCRLQLGLPYGLAGSSNGFVPANKIEELTKEMLNSLTADQRKLFAGYMGWELWADQSTSYVQNLVNVAASIQSAGLMSAAGSYTPRPHAANAQPCGGESSDTCNSDCGTKKCGSNGCGGSCGTCSSGQTCDAGTCKTCQTTCDINKCGDDGCGGSCGGCESGETCSAGQCVCAPQCTGKECGDNGCGGECGSCSNGGQCDSNGKCPVVVPGAKDYCKDGCACHTVLDGEWASKIASNYGVTLQQLQAVNTDIDLNTATLHPGDKLRIPGPCSCTPSCGSNKCGDDGCGGSCGTCSSGQTCDAGTCKTSCTPACSGKNCGSDGCGGTCGTCTGDKTCQSGTCQSSGSGGSNKRYSRTIWWPSCGCAEVNWDTEWTSKATCEAAHCGTKGGAASDAQTSAATTNNNAAVLAIVATAAVLVVGIVVVTALIVVKRTAPKKQSATVYQKFQEQEEMGQTI